MDDENDTSERYRAPALDKGLDILELLARHSIPLTRTEIVKELGRSSSEIYRMLERLVIRGYVTRVGGGDKFCLSMKMFALATQHPPWRRLVVAARPLMDEFTAATLQSCHLVYPERGVGLVIAQSSPITSWEFSVRVGAELSLLDTGSGQTILAFQHEDKIADCLALWGYIGSVDDILALAESFKAIRKQGYRAARSGQLHGVLDISAPIIGPDGSAVAVLTCPVIERIDNPAPTGETVISERLLSVASQISLGWRLE